MLARLATGERTVSELAEPFDMTMPAISKHLKVLERAGMVERSRDAQWRPCTIRPEPIKEAMEWIGQYRTLWENRLNSLDDYLHTLHDKEQGTK